MVFGYTLRPTAARTAVLPALGILQYLDTAKSAPLAIVVVAEHPANNGMISITTIVIRKYLGKVMLQLPSQFNVVANRMVSKRINLFVHKSLQHSRTELL